MKVRRATKTIMRAGGRSGRRRAKPGESLSSGAMTSAAVATSVERATVSNGHAELDKVELLKALLAFRRGDFSIRLAPNLSGLDGKIADAFNDVLEINQKMARELKRINHDVGAEGRLSQRSSVGDASGSWKDSVEHRNNLIANVVKPTRQTSPVIG